MLDYAGSACFCSAGAAAWAEAAAAFAGDLDIFVYSIFPRFCLKLLFQLTR